MLRLFLTAVMVAFVLVGCKKDDSELYSSNYPYNLTGVVKKQAATTFMYGTHTISIKGKTYALKSSNINLDTYVNKIHFIKGKKIEGYPLDGGPEYIDVKEIK